jgi:hypothetical protein
MNAVSVGIGFGFLVKSSAFRSWESTQRYFDEAPPNKALGMPARKIYNSGISARNRYDRRLNPCADENGTGRVDNA